MMSSNKNIGAPMIFYVYATSTIVAIFVTFGSVTAFAMPDQQAIASANMHNSMDPSVTEHSNNLNNFQTNKRIDSIIALSSIPLTRFVATNNASTPLAQPSIEMENSREYLHLDEHNFVATTPKIHTTQLPNRYGIEIVYISFRTTDFI